MDTSEGKPASGDSISTEIMKDSIQGENKGDEDIPPKTEHDACSGRSEDCDTPTTGQESIDVQSSSTGGHSVGPDGERSKSAKMNMSGGAPAESGDSLPRVGSDSQVEQGGPDREPTPAGQQDITSKEPIHSKEQNVPDGQPTPSEEQIIPTDGHPIPAGQQDIADKDPIHLEEQGLPDEQPTPSDEQIIPTDGQPIPAGQQDITDKEPIHLDEQGVPDDQPTPSDEQMIPADGQPTQSGGQSEPHEGPAHSEEQDTPREDPTLSEKQINTSNNPTPKNEDPTQSDTLQTTNNDDPAPKNADLHHTQSEIQGGTDEVPTEGNAEMEQPAEDNYEEGTGVSELAMGEWITQDSVGDSDVEEESGPQGETNKSDAAGAMVEGGTEDSPENSGSNAPSPGLQMDEKDTEDTDPQRATDSGDSSQIEPRIDTSERPSSGKVIPQEGVDEDMDPGLTGEGNSSEQLGGDPKEKNEGDAQGEKDSAGEGSEKDDSQEVGSDVPKETEEPMETDEFDEVERVVKEQSKKEAEEKQAALNEGQSAVTAGEASEEGVTSLDAPNNSTEAQSEGKGDADPETAQTAVESLGVTDGSGEVAGDESAPGEIGADDTTKEQEGQLPLTDSQERQDMLLQYDGEDVLETILSDSQEGEAAGQAEQSDKSQENPGVGEAEELMEVDKDMSEENTSKQESTGADPKEDAVTKEPTPSKPAHEEEDVIDMIDAGTVIPSESKPMPVTEPVEKAASGNKVANGEANVAGYKTAQTEQNKDTSPVTTEEKKRRSGGSSISSIVSRLTQSLADKKTEVPSTEKALPVTNQVKTVAQDTPKEKVGRKPVYKKDEVFNQCSACLNTFLSINPIKFNNNVFCSDACLHKKKGGSSSGGADTSICSNCKTSYKNDLAQKFTLTVGLRERGFCSQTCVGDYQKRVKPCSNCGEDIAGTNNAFMAQVGGDEGKFMEFCSQACVEGYEAKLKEQPQVAKKDSSEKKICSMCSKLTVIKHEVKFRGQYYHMCGADCFASFRKKYNLSLRTCNQCGTTCYNEQSPGDDKEGHKVFFCSQKCLEVFQHSRSLSEPCFNCKTMYKQGMLIEGKSSNNKIYKFCSQECLRKGLPSPAARPPTSTLPSQAPRMATQVQTSTLKPKGVKTSSDTSSQGQGVIPCNHCKKPQRPLYHLTMSDSSLRNFCSYPCVIAFQAQFNVPPVTLPQETLLLKCGQCKRGFSHRPQTLDYQGETRLFCADTCLEDFKKTQSVVAICDCCFEEKILYEETNFLGKARYFCSPGCSLIFKNQFVKRIGLRCAMCDYCSTMCKIATVSVLGGNKKRFCGEECKESYHQWYNRMARCEGCKRMGCELTESFRWRGKVKRVCNEQCLLLFYTQQNVPDMGTQLQSELTSPDKAAKNGTDSSFPTITNVKSLAATNQANSDQMMVKHIPMAHKQTQITTNTIFVKPPPPPPTPPPPAPKQVKNKITLCKPYAVSKGVTCKPPSKNEGSQADLKPVLVPVPIPIFIPVPMQMYTSPAPTPLPIPVPIPTPMFVPVAYSSCDKLLKVMKDIMNTIPSDPLEADILMMATAIAGKEESNKPPPSPDVPAGGDITDLLSLEDSEVLDIPADSDIVGMLTEGLETIDSSDLFPEDRISKSLSRVTRSSTQDDSEPSTRRARTRGAKRVCLDAAEEEDDDNDSPGSPESTKEDVRPDIGPAAYSFYLQQISKDGVLPSDKLKANLSMASVDELHYCLCRFVKEATQPDGEMYPPDTLYLILLSIQKYLMTNNRKENIFMDPYFQTFSGLLHERLGEHSIVQNPHEEIDPGITCLDEEFLWESKQLGAHSPAVLLSTILYYMTKELMLKTADMHQQLAFSRVQKLVRKDSRGKREAYVRVLPSEEQRLKAAENKGKKRPLDLDFSLELHVSTEQPLRCPVKLYEFYLSKCPEVVKTNRTLFYLVPERACVPDSPLWYSDKALPAKSLERYLWRHLMVKDIHEQWEVLRLKKESGSGSDSE